MSTRQLTIHDIVRAALDEFDGAGGVSEQDIDAFLVKLGVAEIKRRLLAGQTIGEAYGGER